ncbi:hypothetical protein [Cohnella sp. GCM10027633]|uniref:hypothetical protein n=1 Tax=unclassified Cohnella TaxID=2636738 RepID=UPI00363B4C76
MSQIRIDVNGVQAEHRSFKSAYRKIKDEGQQLSSTRQRIDGRIAARRGTDSRMSRAGSRLTRVENQLEALYDFIEHGLQSYIQADDKAKEHPFDYKKKKSIWEKIGDGLQAAAHGVTGFMEGTAEAVIGTVEGIWTMVTHPIETVQGLVYVVKHPLQTAQGIWKAVSDSWTNEVANGDADSRGRWFGRMISEVALAVVGTKGVDKVAKLAKGTRIVREGRGVRIVHVDAPEKVHAQPEPTKPSPKPEGDKQPKGLPEASPKAKKTFSDMSADEQLAIAKQYSRRAPIEIPENATMKTKSMADGYEQLTYKWNDGTYKYEVRWHTRTSGAPEDQGNTWVIQRTIPGSGGNKPQSYFKIGENEWVEGYKWYDAIAARKAETATPEQVRILDKGHWKE